MSLTLPANSLLKWAKANNLCISTTTTATTTTTASSFSSSSSFSFSSLDDITHLSMDGTFGGKLHIPTELTNRFIEEYYLALDRFERLKRDIQDQRARYRRDFNSGDNEDKRAEFEYKMANNYMIGFQGGGKDGGVYDHNYAEDPPLSITETVKNCDFFRATFDLDLETYGEHGIVDTEEEIKEYVKEIRKVISDLYFQKPLTKSHIPDEEWYLPIQIVDGGRNKMESRECLLDCIVTMAPDLITDKKHKKSVHIRFRHIIVKLDTLAKITNLCVSRLLEKFGPRESKSRNAWNLALDNHIITVGIRMIFSDKMEQCMECKLKTSHAGISQQNGADNLNKKTASFLTAKSTFRVPKETFAALTSSLSSPRHGRHASICGHYDCVMQKRAANRVHVPRWYVRGKMTDSDCVFDEEEAKRYSKIKMDSIRLLLSRFSYRVPTRLSETMLVNPDLLVGVFTEVDVDGASASDVRGLKIGTRLKSCVSIDTSLNNSQMNLLLDIVRNRLPPTLSLRPWKNLQFHSIKQFVYGNDLPFLKIDVLGMGHKWCMNRMKEHSSNRIYFLVSYQKFEDNKIELVVRQKCYCKNDTQGTTTLTGEAKSCHAQNFPWWRIDGVAWSEIFSPTSSTSSMSFTSDSLAPKTVSELQELLKTNITTSLTATTTTIPPDDTRSVASASSSSSSFTRRLVRNFTDESLRKKVRMD